MIVCKLLDNLTERGVSRRELARQSGLDINTVCDVLRVGPGALLVRESDG